MNRKSYFISIVLILILLVTIEFTTREYRVSDFNRATTTYSPFQTLDTEDLPIGIFFDERYSEPWSFNAQELTNDLNLTLGAYNLTVFVLNATALRSFMENNPVGIIIITMGVAPQTIWNGSQNSFVEAWLDNGGIVIWTGCEEFYWIGTDSGENIPIGHVGAQYVLDMDYIETISNLYMNPTQLGTDLMNNFSTHITDVFSSISALILANVYYEVYGRNGDWADPVLCQPNGGKGYFVRIHANWDDQLPLTNLSTWISSFIYNRFFNLPIITEIDSFNSLYLLTSEELFINVTNFSDEFKILLINSTSDGFALINASTTMAAGESKYLNFTIVPLASARFQQYSITLNLYSNYTNSENETKILNIFSKTIFISVQSPISFSIIESPERMFQGSTYSLTCIIQKHIDPAISIDIILICEGGFNELKIDINLTQTETTLQINFTVQLMAKSGLYQLFLRIYQNEILFSTSSISTQVQTIFENPTFLFILCILLTIIIIFLCLQIYLKKRRRSLEQKILAILEAQEIKSLKKISKEVELDVNKSKKYVNSCIRKKLINGYLVRNEKKEFLFIKKEGIEEFVVKTISKLKTNEFYKIAELLNLEPSELEDILLNQIEDK